MTCREPWSKRHKEVTRDTPFNLSGSFAEPLTNEELVRLSLERGDQAIVDDFHRHSLEYTANGGSQDLREEIARFYGGNIEAQNIVVFAGGQVALQTAATTLLDKDSHSIVFTPGYQSVVCGPVHAGSEVTEIPLSPENGWQIVPEEVEAAIQDNTSYMVINEPYNPAGTLMSRDLQHQLKSIAEKHDIHLLCDEVYRLLEHDPGARLEPMADLYAKGLSVCTLSKPWGGCGVSIGWIALQDLELRQKLVDTQYFGTACPSRSSEIQAIMTLRGSDTILARRLKIIHQNLALLDRFFEDYEKWFDWVRPTAGAIGFVRCKAPLTAEELGDQLAEAGISIKPAYVFTGTSHDHADYFRIGFGEAKMPAALQALIEFVEHNKQAWSEGSPDSQSIRI